MLKIYVQPKSSRPGFKGIYDDMVKLCIGAAPVDGKANKAVVAYLAKFFQVPKKDVHIVSGVTSRRKLCVIGSLDEGRIRCRLEEAGGLPTD